MALSLLRKKKMLFLLFVTLALMYFSTYILHRPSMTSAYLAPQSKLDYTKFGPQGRVESINTRSSPDSSSAIFNLSSVSNVTSVTNVTHIYGIIPGYGSCSLVKGFSGTYFKQGKYIYFTEGFKLDKDPVTSWLRDTGRTILCDEKFVIYDNRFASAQSVLVQPSKILGLEHKAKGGEEVRNVLKQGLEREDYKFGSGFLQLNCTSGSTGGSDYRWMKAVNFNKVDNVQLSSVNEAAVSGSASFDYESRFTVAIQREDYANMHNWAREVFGALLLMMHFNVQPKDAVILFLDGHPFSNLDITWRDLFGQIQRVAYYSKPVLFRHFVLSFKESEGLVSDFRSKEQPYLEECRAFILQQHNLNPNSFIKCGTPTITLLIRRNAVFHPRNVEGKVGRKIYNEAQLIDALMVAFPGACVQGVLMESLPMRSQLQVMSQTDLLIGMHGAGMTHTLFLPKHAAILELFAKDFKRGRPWFECYNAIAKWRGMKYDSWENFDAKTEMPFDFTIVPVAIIVDKAKQLINQLCS